jgi:Tfp pilus assembly protein PilF
LHGDTKGAVEAMRIAVGSASPADPESVAWCSVQLGNEMMNLGNLTAAEHEYDYALFVFPDYLVALAAKAGVRAANGDIDQAIDLYKRAEQRVPLPDTAVALGNLYAKIGRPEDAAQQYALVEAIDRASSALAKTYSRQIALFWADHDKNLDKALAIAEEDRQARGDIFTCDELAWCLFKKGQLPEAKKAIDEALRLGTHDARIYYHAGMIYKGLGDEQQGIEYLKKSLKTNPYFDLIQVEVAKRALNKTHDKSQTKVL